MKRMNLIRFATLAIIVTGCLTSCKTSPSPASPQAVSSSFEGSWTGREITPDHEGPASFKFIGQTVAFHGADPNDWVNGTFLLRADISPKELLGVIKDCSSQDAIGKECHAIYKLENGALTICGYQPGNPDFPPAFDAPGTRQFVLNREQ